MSHVSSFLLLSLSLSLSLLSLSLSHSLFLSLSLSPLAPSSLFHHPTSFLCCMQRFSMPTPIQAAVLPPATRDRADIIGAAQTGSGKTLAFGLPIMQQLLQVGVFVVCGK